VKAAIRWLRSEARTYDLDTERFGAVGHSAGGYLVSLVGTSSGVAEFKDGPHQEQSDRLQAVVTAAGLSDFLRLYEDPSKPKGSDVGAPEERWFGNPVSLCPELATRASAITHTSRDDPRVLLIHAKDDNVVPISQATLFEAALRKAGVPVSWHRSDGQGHGYPSDEDTKQAILKFLKSE
jgi:dipeptidyl aminopeptidase/acylaminoacyl peptidase